MSGHLAGKRVLILGAETEIGRAVTTAVAEAGATVAAVAATSDAEAAFAVQRLTRRLSSGERKVIAQAIDATNEAAVRVMVRQVSKELGGLDAIVWLAQSWLPRSARDSESLGMSYELIMRFGGKELERTNNGRFIIVWPGSKVEPIKVHVSDPAIIPNFAWIWVFDQVRPDDQVAAEVVAAIAGEADSG